MTWKSKKQSVVARSSVEAEFRSMAHGIYKSLWLKMLLTEVGFPVKSSMSLYCDNKATINIAHDPYNIIGPNMWKLIGILSRTI